MVPNYKMNNNETVLQWNRNIVVRQHSVHVRSRFWLDQTPSMKHVTGLI